MSRINIKKHRDPMYIYSPHGNYSADQHIILPKLYRHVEQISEHGRREWVDTNPENGELLLAFRQSKRI